MTRERSTARRRLRLWPAGVVLAAAAVAFGYNELVLDTSEQYRFIYRATIGVCTVGLLVLWALTLSRLPWRWRLGIGATAAAVVGFGWATLEIRDVSGNLVPIFGWKWSEPRSITEISINKELVDSGASPRDGPEAASPAGLGSFPQFLGPGRDATIRGPRLARDWDARPPREVWRREVGPAYSGFAIAGRRAITQEQRGETEAVVCYDAATGAVLWSHGDAARYESTIGGVGPRATPTIDAEDVFTYGATGILSCLDLASGERRWSRDVVGEHGGKRNGWGMSASPLVHAGRVVVCTGGRSDNALAAFDRASGELAWAAGSDKGSYSSPQLLTLGGVEQIVVMYGNAVTGHEAATGAVLWRHDLPGDQPKVAQPLALGPDRLLVSAGYGVGSASYTIARAPEGGWTATEEWRSPRMKAKFANMAHRDGVLWGFDDGVLACIDTSTGERRWKQGRYGHGQILLVDDMLLVTSEDGAVVLVEASGEAHRELARHEVFADKTWNSPALAGPFLFVRNHREAVCLELPVE